MRCGVIMKKEDYDNSELTNVQILGMEVCSPTETVTTSEGYHTFESTRTGIEYIERYVDIVEDEYKSTILNNFSSCYYNKTTNKVVPQYSIPSNRKLNSLNGKYPFKYPVSL